MSPELAVILVSDSLDAIAIALARYRAAVDPARVELVVAGVGAAAGLSADALAATGFPHARLVDGGAGELGTAEWRALHAATAPLVVFGQAHAWPCPGFGDAILAARASGPWAVIGPAIVNANPATLWSRVAMWLSFGRWMDRPPRGPATDVPGHNSAYDREALRSLGAELPTLLEAGWQLQVALGARGHRCFLEPAACMEIVNPAGFIPFVAHFFGLGRLVTGQRVRRWPLARRLLFALATPLVPFLRLRRIVADTIARRVQAPWLGLPLLVLGLVISAAGELVGALRGPGRPTRFVRKV